MNSRETQAQIDEMLSWADCYDKANIETRHMIILLFTTVGTMFGVGGTSVISRALGEGRHEYARKVSSFCMWSCIGVGVLLAGLFLALMNPILTLIGASAETWQTAKTYLTIIAVSLDFQGFSRLVVATGFEPVTPSM